jgi:hypothetical protein
MLIHLNLEPNGSNPEGGSILTDCENGEDIGHLVLTADSQVALAIEQTGQMYDLASQLARESDDSLSLCGNKSCSTCGWKYSYRDQARAIVTAVTGEQFQGDD